jgi:hypothetical protein
MEQGVTRNQIVNELSRSAHGKLAEYDRIIGQACSADPEFLAHLIAWDYTNGQIKDSKIALPVLTAAHREYPDELVENSLAHLAMQPPRELLKALRFSIEMKAPARRQRAIEKTIRGYLAHKESEPGKWNRMVARHRRSIKSLYALTHAPTPAWVSHVLFGFNKTGDGEKVYAHYVPGSIFADIAALNRMDPAQAAATIQKWHLSPLVVSGAMAGAKATQENTAVVQATMDQMSSTEVVTRAKSLERKGVSKDEALKETFRSKVAKATKSGKATLKTGVAADEVEDDSLKTMLRELQERQIQAQKDAGRGVDGNWLVIADKSGSQAHSIEVGKMVAAAIAKFVSGRVWLAFCDVTVAGFDVTGMSLERIQEKAKYIKAHGGTSYGVGLEWAAKQDLDGIAIVGDGAENSVPIFASVYTAYRQAAKKDPPIYLYQTASTEPASACLAFKMFMDRSGVPFTAFDLTHGKVDYYSLPNLVQTMNVSRFGVIEKIMACPLVTLEQVLPRLVAAA